MERKEDIGRMHTAGITIDFEYGELWRGIHRRNPLSFKKPYSFTVYKDRDVYMAEDWRGRIRFEDDNASEVIENAVDSLPNGGLVFLKEGIFDFSKTVELKGKVFIQGCIGSVIRAVSENITLFKATERYWGIFNCYLDGQSKTGTIAIESDTGADDGWIINCVIKNFGSHALYLRNLRSHIRGCDIADVGGDGIRLEYGSDSFIVNNLISASGSGIVLDFTGVCVISGNFIHDIGSFGVNGYNGAHRIIIKGNRFWVVDSLAVWFRYYSSDYNGGDNIVVANEFRDINYGNHADTETIRLESCENNIISLNRFYGSNPVADVYERGTSNNNIITYNRVVNGIVVVGSRTVVRHNLGYPTENSGVATFSGDGSTTEFKIEHGLVSTPSKYVVSPLTPDADASRTITVDDTYITITFDTAPPSGTDNVKFGWWAEV